YASISRFRLDEQTYDVRRLELESRVNFERWSLSVLYGNYAAQPDIGILTRRQGILTSGSVKLTQNWSLTGGVRYDPEAEKINQTNLGLGYIDHCFPGRAPHPTPYGYTPKPHPIHTPPLQTHPPPPPPPPLPP